MKLKIVMVRLRTVSFVQDDYLHTVAYARDAKDWLKQWTVANNFRPVVAAVEDTGDFVLPEEMGAVISDARKVLIAQHLEMLHSALSLHTKVERDYAKDFEFAFDIFMADSGASLELVGHATTDRHSILKGSL